jgi:hypothetical protein
LRGGCSGEARRQWYNFEARRVEKARGWWWAAKAGDGVSTGRSDGRAQWVEKERATRWVGVTWLG